MMARVKRDTTGVLVRMSRPSLDALDDLIATFDDAPSRPEMIRQLVNEGLKQRGYIVGQWIE